MKPQYASWGARGVCALALTVFSVMVATPKAHSEAYIAGQFGVALPSISGGLTNAEFNFTTPNVDISDVSLKTSFLYGGKVGYYFSQVRWFGVETEVYNTTPHVKQQELLATVPAGTFIPGFGTTQQPGTLSVGIPGNYLRVLMWAPVNFMFRYPNGRLQPYIGFGPGIFFAHAGATGSGVTVDQTNIRVGANAKIGAELYLTRHIAVFGEWKYNWVMFNFDKQLGFEGRYEMHLVAGGLSYHF